MPFLQSQQCRICELDDMMLTCGVGVWWIVVLHKLWYYTQHLTITLISSLLLCSSLIYSLLLFSDLISLLFLSSHSQDSIWNRSKRCRSHSLFDIRDIRFTVPAQITEIKKRWLQQSRSIELLCVLIPVRWRFYFCWLMSVESDRSSHLLRHIDVTTLLCFSCFHNNLIRLLSLFCSF